MGVFIGFVVRVLALTGVHVECVASLGLTGRVFGYRALIGLCEEMRLNFERVFD